MTRIPQLGALALALTLATAACSEGNRRPVSYPGTYRGTVSSQPRSGGSAARPNKAKNRDGTRCNAGRGNGNGNGRCRNGNRGRNHE